MTVINSKTKIKRTGKRVGLHPVNEALHFMQCRACGQFFDMRELDQVFYHEEPDHKPKYES